MIKDYEIKRILVKQGLKSLTMILEIIFKLLFQGLLKLKLFFETFRKHNLKFIIIIFK